MAINSDGVDEGVYGDAGIFFGELGDVGVTRGGGWAGVTEQVLNMA